MFSSNGGAVAVGHLLGAPSARLAVSLVHERRRRGVGFGLSAMCVGYGRGVAVGFRVQ